MQNRKWKIKDLNNNVNVEIDDLNAFEHAD